MTTKIKLLLFLLTLTFCMAALTLAKQAQAQSISTTAWYTVTNQNSGKCVDDTGGGITNDTHVQQWTCYSGSANQQWQFQTTDSGYYKIITKNSGTMVWDVAGPSTANGALVHLWTYVSGTNQQWLPTSLGGGYYKFVNRYSGSCLDVPSASTADGVQLQQYTCNGTAAQSYLLTAQGIPNPTNTPSGGFVVSESQFNSWFPNRNGLYTYANFITALGTYPSIAQSGNTWNDKIEAAAFFAHVAHESGYLQYTDELNYTWGQYSACGTYPCASGQDYHGRGPLQISWNYNYNMASYGWYFATPGGWVDRMVPAVNADILNNPNLVDTDGVITWKTALWFWLDHGLDWDPPKSTPHDHIGPNGPGFGETTRDINGGLECGQGVGTQGYNAMMDRVNIYNTFLSNLGVSDGRTKTC